jgi:hypothetical protein
MKKKKKCQRDRTREFPPSLETISTFSNASNTQRQRGSKTLSKLVNVHIYQRGERREKERDAYRHHRAKARKISLKRI